MIRKFYKFLCRHSIGVIRGLYLMPIIAVVLRICSGDLIYKVIILYCLAISLTIQIGSACEWER